MTQPSPFSLEVLRVLAEVHRQLPVARPLHFDLQQSSACWETPAVFSWPDSHTGCFRWAASSVGLYPLQEVELRKHGGSHQLHGGLVVPLGFLGGGGGASPQITGAQEQMLRFGK